ncbi:MAG TPA: YdcF family protein [Albitalea sp.]|nr:YdcF family protein [Albitalea sp.]
MNTLVTLLGIESWKPVLSALMLPPVPLLLLMLVGTRVAFSRRALGWMLVLLGASGIWLSTCMGTARAFERHVLQVPPTLTAQRITQLKGEARSGATAIVVLGGGVEALAPEYGTSSITDSSLERLRYGVWLGRQTGLPVAFSGGSGWAQPGAGSEAEIAARIAAQEFDHPLRWTEAESRDTRENAARTVPLLRHAGITHIVLVTHGSHMPRAERNFEAAAAAGGGMRIEPAPMGMAPRSEAPLFDWLPSRQGYARTRNALHEWLGSLLGA